MNASNITIGQAIVVISDINDFDKIRAFVEKLPDNELKAINDLFMVSMSRVSGEYHRRKKATEKETKREAARIKRERKNEK